MRALYPPIERVAMGDNTDKVREILNKCYGADVTYLMADVSDAADTAIGTGITAFDFGLLGIGGIPRGHFFELSGEEKAGKTTMVLHMIAACQREGMVPLVIDPKGAVTTDVARAQRIGVNADDCILVPVDSSDEVLQRTREALGKLKKEDIEVAFFWDDMGLTPSDAELAPKRDQKTKKEIVKVGSKASSIWRFCRSLAGACYKMGAPMVVVNQLTAKITTDWTAQYAEKEQTAGGGGLKYTARIRTELRKGKRIKRGDNKIAQVVFAQTIANAFFPPFKRVQLYLNFRDGYDSVLSTMLNAEKASVVSKSKGRYKMKGAPRGTKGAKLEDLDEETLWAIEAKLWPWLDESYTGEEGKGDEEDLDEDEEAEEAFLEGYLDE